VQTIGSPDWIRAGLMVRMVGGDLRDQHCRTVMVGGDFVKQILFVCPRAGDRPGAGRRREARFSGALDVRP
jgi:hypothetical protein